jgi:hypothetical protein
LLLLIVVPNLCLCSQRKASTELKELSDDIAHSLEWVNSKLEPILEIGTINWLEGRHLSSKVNEIIKKAREDEKVNDRFNSALTSKDKECYAFKLNCHHFRDAFGSGISVLKYEMKELAKGLLDGFRTMVVRNYVKVFKSDEHVQECKDYVRNLQLMTRVLTDNDVDLILKGTLKGWVLPESSAQTEVPVPGVLYKCPSYFNGVDFSVYWMTKYRCLQYKEQKSDTSFKYKWQYLVTNFYSTGPDDSGYLYDPKWQDEPLILLPDQEKFVTGNCDMASYANGPNVFVVDVLGKPK